MLEKFLNWSHMLIRFSINLAAKGDGVSHGDFLSQPLMKAQGLLLKQLWEDGYAREKARVMPSTVREFDPLNNLRQSR